MTATAELKVCTECIGDTTFSSWIKENGQKGKCDFNNEHGKNHAVVSIEKFAAHVDDYFRDNYGPGEGYAYAIEESDNPQYATYGQPYEEILSDDLCCDGDVLDAVIENLPDDVDYGGGEEAFYEPSRHYESLKTAAERGAREYEDYLESFWYENDISFQWKNFCETVQRKKRFFGTKELLDELFGSQSEYEKGRIKPLYTLDVGKTIYRARILENGFTTEELADQPHLKLDAPPYNKTKAGRMNVEFIPAFYGAFSERTAIAEVRPSIGDAVAVGTFSLNRKMRVFDFTVFDTEHEKRKKKAEDGEKHTRYEFIKRMQEEISKPITPFEKAKEYIPTQIVAEYLATFFDCEAVIYKSSMHKGKRKTNRNIVILGKGSRHPFSGVSSNSLLSFSEYHLKRIDNVRYKYDIVE